MSKAEDNAELYCKSTLVGLFCAWLLYENCNSRILIMSADYELAKKMVRNVKRIIERHPLTTHLKPKQKDQWASDRFTIIRSQELRDPSVLARGIDANITGCRADVIVCDDVEVPKNCDTEAKRNDLKEKLSELDFIVSLYTPTTHDSSGEKFAILSTFSAMTSFLVRLDSTMAEIRFSGTSV